MARAKRRRRRHNLTGVDIVAIILAIGLSSLVCLIIVATIVQILHNAPGVPEIQLSENSTQILIAAIGGIVGVLGGYIGNRMKGNHMSEEQTPTVDPPEGDPEENDDKTDVQPRPEPKEEGDPHGSPLDDPDDERHLRDLRKPEEPAA